MGNDCKLHINIFNPANKSFLRCLELTTDAQQTLETPLSHDIFEMIQYVVSLDPSCTAEIISTMKLMSSKKGEVLLLACQQSKIGGVIPGYFVLTCSNDSNTNSCVFPVEMRVLATKQNLTAMHLTMTNNLTAISSFKKDPNEVLDVRLRFSIWMHHLSSFSTGLTADANLQIGFMESGNACLSTKLDVFGSFVTVIFGAIEEDTDAPPAKTQMQRSDFPALVAF
jgi:hypothetical protein